jgi:methyl-accepting chemotaxis protein
MMISWNDGLRKKWAAADGGMESNIGHLRQLYHLQRMSVLPIKTLQNRMADIADGEGNLTRRLTSSRKDEIGLLANTFDRFVDKIHKLVSQTAENVESLQQVRDTEAASEQIRAIGSNLQGIVKRFRI